LDCSLRSLRIALGSRLLRRRSTTKNPSAHSSSARRRAIRRWIARSARCGSRWEAAYFVIAQRRKARRLTPPQHGGVRSAVGLLAPLAVHRAGRPPTSSSLNDESASAHSSSTQLVAGAGARYARAFIGGTPARDPLLIARCRAAMFGKCRRIRQASRTPGVTNGGLVITKVS
jgi:hypothetical protein